MQLWAPSQRTVARSAWIAAGLMLGLCAGPARAVTEPFPVWLEGVRQEALAQGISPETLASALDGLEPIERVIELDRRQVEGRITFQEYRKRVLSDERVERGRALLREHQALLEKIGAEGARDRRVPRGK
jgi:membrane-bound lytic murein transglycosylase B